MTRYERVKHHARRGVRKFRGLRVDTQAVLIIGGLIGVYWLYSKAKSAAAAVEAAAIQAGQDISAGAKGATTGTYTLTNPQTGETMQYTPTTDLFTSAFNFGASLYQPPPPPSPEGYNVVLPALGT